MRDSAWDEMLDEFRALGGTADNIRLGTGEFGRGLFPVDPTKPVVLRVPKTLLVDTADMVFEDGALCVRAGAAIGTRERAFIESYEDRFSWGGGGRAGIERVFAQAQALPTRVRDRLRVEHRCGAWFDQPTPERIQERFLASRCVAHDGRAVLMPIVALANRGAGADFDVSDGLAGRFADEVLVRFPGGDSYGLFLTFGIAHEQPQAFSIALAGHIADSQLAIAREFGGLTASQRAWVPALSRAEGRATLDFLMIGNRQYPRLCRGIFYKLMRDIGGFEEAFDTIQHVNRMHFLDLLAALEGVEGPMASTLRRMAGHQLSTMSFSFGVRAV